MQIYCPNCLENHLYVCSLNKTFSLVEEKLLVKLTYERERDGEGSNDHHW